jgi:hypothetical protein
MAVAYWIEQAAWNTDKSVEAHKKKLLDADLQRFMEHAIGYKPKQKGWLNSGRVALGKPSDSPRKGDRRNFRT